MSAEDMAKELERLRADVAALQAARRESEAAAVSPAPRASSAEATEEPPEEPADAESGEMELSEAVKAQLEELGDLLHEEVKNMPAVTSLAVFTLGILVGRFLR